MPDADDEIYWEMDERMSIGKPKGEGYEDN